MDPEDTEFESKLSAEGERKVRRMRYELDQGILDTLSRHSIPSLEGHPRWEALLVADTSLNFRLFNELLIGLIKSISVQTIEANLRAAGAVTWLVARLPLRGLKGWRFAVNPNAKYSLWVSMRPLGVALTELLKESQSYNENFDKLAVSDMVAVIDQDVFQSSAKELEKQGHQFEWFEQEAH